MIIEYDSKYDEEIKDLLVDLQNYLIDIDDWHTQISVKIQTIILSPTTLPIPAISSSTLTDTRHTLYCLMPFVPAVCYMFSIQQIQLSQEIHLPLKNNPILFPYFLLNNLDYFIKYCQAIQVLVAKIPKQKLGYPYVKLFNRNVFFIW